MCIRDRTHLSRMLTARKRLASTGDKLHGAWERCVTSSTVLRLLVPGYGSLVAMTMTRRLLTVAGGRTLDVFVVGAEGAPLVVNLPGTPEGHVLFPSVEKLSLIHISEPTRPY